MSRRFAAMLGLATAATLIAWQATVRQGGSADLYLAIVGGLLLAEIGDGLDHLRTITLFRQALNGTLDGQIEYSRRALFTVRYVDLYGLAGLFTLLFLVAGSWFCAGGALACVVSAQRARDWVIVRT